MATFRILLQTGIALAAAVPVALFASPLIISLLLATDPLFGAAVGLVHAAATGATVAAGSLLFAWQVVRSGHFAASALLFGVVALGLLIAISVSSEGGPGKLLAGCGGLVLGCWLALRFKTPRSPDGG